jgi:hypothetical protein
MLPAVFYLGKKLCPLAAFPGLVIWRGWLVNMGMAIYSGSVTPIHANSFLRGWVLKNYVHGCRTLRMLFEARATTGL